MTGIRLDHVAVDPARPALLVAGEGRPARVRLVGPRQTVEGELGLDGERWNAVLPLLGSSWGGPALAPRSGDYRLETLGPDDAPLPLTGSAVIPAAELIERVARLSFPTAAADAGTPLVVRISAPLTDRERGPQQQAAREADYRAARYCPANAVFF